jgi:gliding motility-associated-like protein
MPQADFTITPSSTIYIPNYTFGFLNLTPNYPIYKYNWSLGDGSFAITRDVVSHLYNDTGNYEVRLTVLDTTTSCVDTVIKYARIVGNPGYLYVPNAFYANSTQLNFKYFKPLGKGLAEYELLIFDSWGKLLFRTTKLDYAGSPVDGWDGTYKGAPMPQDAYAWKIKARFRNGKIWEGMNYDQSQQGQPAHSFGTITLFR